MTDDNRYQLHLGDCLEVMRTMEDNSCDSIVCDPPYALSFMGAAFDTFHEDGVSDNVAFQKAMTPIFAEALRVAKPGAHLLAFGGTRTYHRLASAIEDAGWEVRDQIAWVYGSGMPKGLDVSKAIDKKRANSTHFQIMYENALAKSGLSHADIDRYLGIKSSSCYWVRTDSRKSFPTRENWEKLKQIISFPEDAESVYSEMERLDREVSCYGDRKVYGDAINVINRGTPVSDEALKWEGWNSALKPAFEPIVLARKPVEGTIAENVLKYGTGAINIDACRVPLEVDDALQKGIRNDGESLDTQKAGWRFKSVDRAPGIGRYPANLLYDGSPEVLACFPDGGTSAAPRPVNANHDGEQSSDVRYTEKGNTNFAMKPGMRRPPTSPARFFYCAKASRSERGEGNVHPTVKPLALMRWCVTLVAPKDSVVLDPFMGSGSTGIAALQCGCRFVGIEKEPEYMKIAQQRIATALDEPIQDDYKNEPTETADCPDASDKSPRTSTIQQGELNL